MLDPSAGGGIAVLGPFVGLRQDLSRLRLGVVAADRLLLGQEVGPTFDPGVGTAFVPHSGQARDASSVIVVPANALLTGQFAFAP